ncbi:hypothetical protein LINPERPRIM_LOCUS27069 [Linum perenne]
MNGGGSGQNEPESKLKEGIFLILSRWSALLFAVDEETAGRGSRGLADKLFSDIFTWFTRKRKAEEPLYIDDLEEILHEGATSLLIEFEDDGAEIEEVAEVLMIMHQEWLAGDYSYVEKLRTAPKPPASGQRIVQAAGDDNDSSSSDEGDMAVSGGGESDMAVDSPVTMTEPAPPQTDDDGWTVVASSSRRNRGSRN